MIKEFIKAWDKRNKFLLNEFKTTAPESYEDIVKKLVNIVINPYLEAQTGLDYSMAGCLDIDNMTVINNGDYQGTTIYIIPYKTYQPSVEDYVYTYNYYGSCSGCDTFQSIVADIEFDWETEKYVITDTVAKDFHTLALHILQRFKVLFECEESEVNE